MTLAWSPTRPNSARDSVTTFPPFSRISIHLKTLLTVLIMFDRWWRAVGAARGSGAHNGKRGLSGDVSNRRALEIDFGQLSLRRIRERPEGLLRGNFSGIYLASHRTLLTCQLHEIRTRVFLFTIYYLFN